MPLDLLRTNHRCVWYLRQVQLDFRASFFFTASLFGWTLYRARPLEVTTRLTTETVKGRTLGGSGSRIDASGHARQANRTNSPTVCCLYMSPSRRRANSKATMFPSAGWSVWQPCRSQAMRSLMPSSGCRGTYLL